MLKRAVRLEAHMTVELARRAERPRQTVFRKHYGTDPSDYRAEANQVVVAYEVEEDGAPSD